MTSGENFTARVLRERERVDLSKALRRSLDKHDVSQKVVSLETGAKESIVSHWCDPQAPETPGLADIPGIAAASRSVARDLLSLVAEKIGLSVIERVEAAGSSDWMRALREHSKHTHAVTCAITGALEDHEVSDEELAAIEAEAASQEKQAASMREGARAELARRRAGKAAADGVARIGVTR